MTTAPPRRTRTPLATAVVRREQLTPHLVRVVLGGGDLVRFVPLESTDSYVKLVFGERVRTYTVRAFDPVSHELTLDIVTHGEAGLAGPWAQTVEPGTPVELLGPGGGYAPDPAAASHLLVGDESALPAIAVALAALPETATVAAYVEVASAEETLPLERVSWIHRDGAPVGERLVAAVTATDLPLAGVHAFVHGEAGFVKQLRGWLRDSGVPRERTSISGYWRLGVDDEGWRAVKRTFDTD